MKCPYYDKCPECGGELKHHELGDEDVWWCEDCDVAVDSDGGYTN